MACRRSPRGSTVVVGSLDESGTLAITP